MHNPALETIRKVGVTELCHTDGCLCMRFSVHHVDVDISCRKSSGCKNEGGTTIKVGSPSLEFYDSDHPKAEDARLRAVGDEVAKQLAELCGYDLDSFLVVVEVDN